ncbi:hypothetical protein OEZ86_001880 [Tetradesmus obliquus]|nr:hypothetical protein OEZ86_001880 [Tetradesmus obliquus]
MVASVPLVVLQGIKPLLSLSDIQRARLTCKEWAGELAASVNSVKLPPHLWQLSNPKQQRELRRLVTTYWSFKHAILQAGRPEGLSLLLQLPHIQHLTLHSSSSGKLQQQHVAAIAGMQQLKSLKLCFRTVAGALAEPLTLDCLGELGKLTHLEIRYTGMQELATGVCFASEDLLPGCKQLVSLVLSRVPMPSLRGLFKLVQLRQVTLLQLAPLDDNQARSLGLCRQLQQLTLDNMPLDLLPRLATLTALTALQLSLYSPPAAAAQGLPGGPNLLSLSALVNLQTLSLSGPVLVPAEQVQVFAAAWGRLRKLSLRVTLQGGSRGFAGFKVLEVLRVKPWCGGGSRPVGDAGLGGEEEGPLLSGVGGIAAAGATAGALSRSNSASFGRMAFGNISNTAGSSGGAAPYATNSSANASSSRGFSLTSMGSIPTLQSMGSASLANMITDALGVGGSGSRGSGTGLSSMGSALNKGSGLAVLGPCSQLEELSIVIGDRGLGPRAREAIAALPQLRKLKVCVAADAPAAAVRDLGGWLAGLRQLQWVGVGLEGPGAADALPGLLDRLTCSLPACQVHMLKGRIGAAA